MTEEKQEKTCHCQKQVHDVPLSPTCCMEARKRGDVCSRCHNSELNPDMGEVSDSYHTFNELYEHRIALYIALCKSMNPYIPWRSKTHSDGSVWEGWFVLGLWVEKGKQITYHLPLSKWEETNFVTTLDKAPEYDGHTPQDVINRLSNL